MQHLPPKKPSQFVVKGDRIEVRRPNDAVTWHPATFIRFCGDRAYVKLETSADSDDPTSPLRREYVAAAEVRPAQPVEIHRYFKVGESVEAFCGERKGWRRGEIAEILENSRYSVVFEGADRGGSASAVEQWEVRTVRDWSDGMWNPPLLLQQVMQVKSKSSSESQAKSNGLKLKIKCKKKPQQMRFSEGMLVEVKRYEKGFEGSWFIAVIVKPLEDEKYLVEYRTLRTGDQTEYLREEVHASCIRCTPPVIRRVKPFESLERVDAWSKSGWWEGYIVEVLNGGSYMVHLCTNEDLILEHRKLRPHQEWIDGKWFSDLKVEKTELNVKPNNKKLKIKNRQTAEPIFREGMMVEVRSDEEGYHGSWFTAEIVCSLASGEFLVEYQTLKTDDESALLREEALASYIRPCAPEIMRIDCYMLLEEVDAWYNDGWWVGLVSKVLDDRRYGVYFWTTNEEIFFNHSDLRSHQDWIGGKWTAAMMKKAELRVNNRQVIKFGEHDRMGVEPFIVNGMKAEIKGDHGDKNEGIWYPAIILKSLGIRNYLVQYQTLINEYGTQLHQKAFGPCIRPSPSVIQRRDSYKPFDRVDAWHNNGWRVGRVQKASPSRNYTVYFNATNEMMEFQHFELRPHQDWIQGQWVLAIRGS
ncbi:protein AGENET DOMAIN (AGD)-CONTAINING P1-like [Salvia hispanica]|uniref:protein AGENET DOMAIN (AGD)-CONTAINING P1-like n=2 Tax=Salvia hispanica TaxID=49212 RepID=UPI0020091F28|nr:protein AGENET DOMAIN (AGD)-CONTAINING P1-like [Salvia hispanica]